jgi:hypothetical protein
MTDPKDLKPLGTVPQGARDTKLDAGQPATPAPQPDLDLPNGAMIAFRKSGGLRFTSHSVYVYPDGRVSIDQANVPKDAHARLPRKFTDAQIKNLQHTLDKINFYRLPASQGKQNPDAYAYEIAARVGKKSNSIEVFAGSVPESIAPLVEQLSALLPKEA